MFTPGKINMTESDAYELLDFILDKNPADIPNFESKIKKHYESIHEMMQDVISQTNIECVIDTIKLCFKIKPKEKNILLARRVYNSEIREFLHCLRCAFMDRDDVSCHCFRYPNKEDLGTLDELSEDADMEGDEFWCGEFISREFEYPFFEAKKNQWAKCDIQIIKP
jgi:hypothetical protein